MRPQKVLNRILKKLQVEAKIENAHPDYGDRLLVKSQGQTTIVKLRSRASKRSR